MTNEEERSPACPLIRFMYVLCHFVFLVYVYGLNVYILVRVFHVNQVLECVQRVFCLSPIVPMGIFILSYDIHVNPV